MIALDVCCGSRQFYFDKHSPRIIKSDRRRESCLLTDRTAKNPRILNVSPELRADFTALPFRDSSFPLVIFDPPHLIRLGQNSWLAKKYGKLGASWKDDIRAGFAECFRVLAPNGALVFKWCERDIPVSEILALTLEKPLVGHKSGKAQLTHWMVFLKEVNG